jgi:uncharacterized protein (DUF885 family)
MKAILIILPLILFLSCSQQDKSSSNSYNDSLDSLFREYYEFKKHINPIEATKAGYNEYNDQLANYVATPYINELIEGYSKFLEALSEYDSTQVTPARWLSLRVMKWDCEIKREGLTNKLVTIASPLYDLPNFELTPIIQIQSLHLYFSQLAGGSSVQPFHTVTDYDNWLARVDAYIPFLDTCIANMQQGIKQNVVLPKSLIKKIIPQLEPFISTPLQQHIFYTPILNMPANFSEADKKRLTEAYANMITIKLIPKYRQLNEFMVNEYLPAGRETSGIGAVPNGAETYKYLLRLSTTTNMTADEIHELGLKEVARIESEMEKVKEAMNFKGDLKSFINYIRSSKEQMPFAKPEEIIANFNSIHERLNKKLGDVFAVSPKAGFEVRRTEAFREASASAEYVPGSKDATRHGTFYVPIPDVKNYNKFADEALFLHEAIPGHHYQLSLQQENTELPEFLHPESMGVFVEGWALYSESLGKELGLYEDPIQYFGMLSMEMHRAIRLVVDTGIHGKGWTREQAIAFSLEHEAESEADITTEIERYMATPGQAVSYKIGQLKIKELRTRAENELGDKFSIKEFHKQVLNSGSLPLVLLDEKISGWIKEVKAN